MIVKRAGDSRGRTRISWLDSRHSFSFGEYYDPRHMGFGAAPGHQRGLGRAGERGSPRMAIATWRSSPTSSRARSSTRTAWARGSIIRPGEVQRMSAGHRHPAQRVQPLPHRAGASAADLDPARRNRASSPATSRRRYPRSARNARFAAIAGPNGEATVRIEPGRAHLRSGDPGRGGGGARARLRGGAPGCRWRAAPSSWPALATRRATAPPSAARSASSCSAATRPRCCSSICPEGSLAMVPIIRLAALASRRACALLPMSRGQDRRMRTTAHAAGPGLRGVGAALHRPGPGDHPIRSPGRRSRTRSAAAGEGRSARRGHSPARCRASRRIVVDAG